MINLLKPLHDLVEKLVVEHGSAVIQERHILLLKTELAVLEKKIIVLETENQKLKLEKTQLEKKDAIIQDLRQEIEKLNGMLSRPITVESDFDIFHK